MKPVAPAGYIPDLKNIFSCLNQFKYLWCLCPRSIHYKFYVYKISIKMLVKG